MNIPEIFKVTLILQPEFFNRIFMHYAYFCSFEGGYFEPLPWCV